MADSAATHEWVWNRGGVGIEGDHLQWYESVTATSFASGAYVEQSFDDFLAIGPAVEGVPNDVRDGVRRAINARYYVARVAAASVPRDVRIGIHRHGLAWARVSAALGLGAVLGPLLVLLLGLPMLLGQAPYPAVNPLQVVLAISAVEIVGAFSIAVLVWRPRGPGSSLAFVVWIGLLAVVGSLGITVFNALMMALSPAHHI